MARVHTFFDFHPHAHHIIHRPTFMAHLQYPPNHADFPHVAVLHAICAVGSFYTNVVPQPPLPDFRETPAGKQRRDIL